MTYRGISRVAFAIATLALATACSSDAGPTRPNPQPAHVRVVNLFSSAPAVGLFVNGTQAGTNVAFGSASSTCFDVPIGYGITFREAGSSMDIPVSTGVAFTATGIYTVVLYGTSTSSKMAGFADAGAPAPAAGNNELRVFNGTATAGDVWITAPDGAPTGTPSVGNATPSDLVPPFRSYPTANTQIRLFDVGTTTGTPRVNKTFSSTKLSASRVGTAFLTEANLPGTSTNASVVAAPCG